MGNKSLKNGINVYFETATDCNVDTKKLINKLKPTIVNKCAKIKTQKEDMTQTVIFVICTIIAAVIGAVVLLPDIVDLTNEVIQFSYSSLIVFGGLTGSIILVSALVKEIRSSQVLKIRREVL